jgi:hypothetical protein
MTEQPNHRDADDPSTKPEDRTPAMDEATPEQPVIQRAGTPLVDDDGEEGDAEGLDHN